MKKILHVTITLLLTALLLCSCSSDPQRVEKSDNLIDDIDVSSLSSEENYDYGNGNTTVPTSYTEFQKSALNFSFELLRNTQRNTDSTVVAPANAYLQMALMANASAKTTKTEITDAFGKEITLSKINQCIQYFQTRLSCFNDKSDKNAYFINMKNSIWCNDVFDIKKEFLKTDAFYYNNEVYRFLFSESNTLAKLNNWVKDYSNADENAFNSLDSEAYMYFAEAIGIKDNWLEDYANNNILTDTFNGTEKSSEATYYASSEFFIESDTCKGFIKDFKNTPLKLCVIVPDEDISIDEYLNNLTSDVFLTMLNNMDVLTRCNAYLPGFSVNNTVDITASLENMGISTLFTEEADVSNLTRTEDVYVSQILQTINFDISENGISSTEIQEKSTANSVLDNEVTVKADRPFIFAVIDNESNIPLYLGIVENI